MVALGVSMSTYMRSFVVWGMSHRYHCIQCIQATDEQLLPPRITHSEAIRALPSVASVIQTRVCGFGLVEVENMIYSHQHSPC